MPEGTARMSGSVGSALAEALALAESGVGNSQYVAVGPVVALFFV